ncbi:Phosphatidylserine decarboxylase proenzyme 3 [Camellia lanceoleosa]|nr:Phosphatidylserine decarboxylase proenzyme 3 [Camellia lanceoleosa]
MLLPTPTGCVSSTTVCVSSGGCVSSENVSGVPISCGHASEADNTLPLVALFCRPVLIPGTMVPVSINIEAYDPSYITEQVKLKAQELSFLGCKARKQALVPLQSNPSGTIHAKPRSKISAPKSPSLDSDSFDDYHHRSTPCFSDIVLVASDDDSGKPASNPIPVSAHKAVLDYDGDGKLSFSEFSDLINAFGNQLAADKVHPDLQI